MKVAELMTRNVRTCCETESLADAARLLWEGDCGCAPVVSREGSGRIVGMITDRDIGMATHFRGALQGDIPIADVMSSAVRTVGPGESIEVAEALMRDAQLRRLPVVDSEQRLVGLLSLADLALRTNGRSGRAGATAQGISRTLRAISEPRHAVKLPSHAS